MKEKYTIELDPVAAMFYKKMASMSSEGETAEELMADMLFMVAGELSLKALHEDGIEPEDVARIAEERMDM